MTRALPCASLILGANLTLAQPLSPAESAAKMEIEKGFHAELFAAEPDVIDPVAIAFDERGRVYACELREMEALPALEPGAKATIRLLEDLDGDGKCDRATMFAEGLSFPTGIAPFRGGVYVMATPDLLYLKDADGDGVADERRVVLTGFAQGNAEHRFNNLRWSFDNWLYAANGHGGGKVFDPVAKDAEPLELAGRDFRLNPWSPAARFESVSRQAAGGFGLAFDDWGRRYVTHNEVHCTMVLLPQEDLERNPNLALRATSEDISAEPGPSDKVYPISKPQAWRIERTERRAREEAQKFRADQLQVNGYFTAACGLTVYGADLFPESHRGSLFVCDAAQNLVHRSTLTESGTSMIAKRADEGTEFLRSSDSWFRPVNLAVGPDGALYIADFCREIIETGASIPPDIQKKIDLRAGSDLGRIWRIVPDGAKPRGPGDLGAMDDARLADHLASPNQWTRLTAQRLLIERHRGQSAESFASLAATFKKLAKESPAPLGRLHALWTLEGLAALDEPTLLAALDDPHPRVREQAAKLAENSFRKR